MTTREKIDLIGPLAIVQGETYRQLSWTVPGDKTAWTPRAQIRLTLLDDANGVLPLAAFEFDAAIYDADADTTEFFPFLSAPVTASLPRTKYQGDRDISSRNAYYYDLEIESDDGEVVKLAIGRVQVIGQVTGPDSPPDVEIITYLQAGNNLDDLDDVEEARTNLGIVGGVKPDWNATPGDSSEILNQPVLGTAAAANVEDFATPAQGAKAETALQPGSLSDYVTESELTTALGGKQDSGDYLTPSSLSDYEASTQLNARDTANRDRANHSGTQAISTIDGLETALSGKENADPTILKSANIGISVQPYNSKLIPLDALTDKALYYYDATSGLMLPIGVGAENQTLIAKPTSSPPYQWAAPSGGGGGRELLTADRTYYVRTDGSDSNNGLADTPGSAFRAPQKAIDVMAGLDIGIYNATGLVRDGTYDGKIRLKSYVGSGRCFLRGNPSNVSGVVLDYTTGSGSIDAVIDADGVLSPWYIGDFSIAATATNRFSIRAWNGASIVIDKPVRFNATNGGSHIFLDNYGKCFVNSNYSINGATGNHIFARVGSTFIVSGSYPITLTLTSASWTNSFINAQRLSLVDYWGFTLSGSATGAWYTVSTNSVIFTNGATLPGSLGGFVASGGQYS